MPDAVRARPARQALIPDADGPHVRRGLAWMVTVVVAAMSGPGWLALLLAATAGAGAWSVGRRFGLQASDLRQLVLVAGTVALPLAALEGVWGVLVSVALLVAATLVAGLLEAVPPGPRRVEDTAVALMVSIALGLAAASPVLASRLGLGAAVSLLVLAAAYDTGAYLVGAGASQPWEGPVAGALAVAVATFSLGVLNAPDVVADRLVPLAAVFALLAPVGVVLGRVLVAGDLRGGSSPRARPPSAPAPTPLSGVERLALGCVGRLDVLVLAGPIWVHLLAGLR